MTRAWITSTIQRCLLYLTAVKLTQTTSLNTTTPAEGAKLKISHWVFIRGKLTLAVMEGNLAEEWWNVIRSWSVTVLYVIVQSQYFYSQCNAKILLHLLYQQLITIHKTCVFEPFVTQVFDLYLEGCYHRRIVSPWWGCYSLVWGVENKRSLIVCVH